MLDSAAEASISNSPYHPIYLGRYFDGGAASYPLAEANNFHILIAGYSGSGKTFAIRQLVRELHARGVTVLMIDAQGDLDEIPGVSAGAMNDIEFKYVNGTGSINPLRVDPVEEGGGVYMAKRQFIEIVKIFNPALGNRQINDLDKLLTMTYAGSGISHEDPSTWLLPQPTLYDLHATIDSCIKSAFTCLPPDLFSQARELRKKMHRLKTRLSRTEDPDKIVDMEHELESNLEDLQSQAQAILAKEFNGKERRSPEWDLARLEALEHTIGGMLSSHLFDGDGVSVRPRMINRFLITGLHDADQQIVFHLLLDRVFSSAMRTCRSHNPSTPNMVVVLDEGKLAAANARHPLSPLNRIATEGRKYGLGAVVGVQSPGQITDDMQDNFGAVMLLPIKPQRFDEARRGFRVTPEMLTQIKPRSDALFSMNNSPFKPVHLFR